MDPESPPLFKLSREILLRPREWRFTGPGPNSPGDEPPSRYNQRRVCRCMTYKIFVVKFGIELRNLGMRRKKGTR